MKQAALDALRQKLMKYDAARASGVCETIALWDSGFTTKHDIAAAREMLAANPADTSKDGHGGDHRA